MTIEEKRIKQNEYMRKYREEHKEEISYTQHRKYVRHREKYLKAAAEYRRKQKLKKGVG